MIYRVSSIAWPMMVAATSLSFNCELGPSGPKCSSYPTTLQAAVETTPAYAESDSNVLPLKQTRVLRLRDKSGVDIVLHLYEIDYTSYSLVYTPDRVRGGIRVYQGQGVSFVQWDRILRIENIGKDTSGTQHRLKAELTLKGESAKPFFLKMDSGDGLSGYTDQGPFSIRLDQLHSITPDVVENRPEEFIDPTAGHSGITKVNESLTGLLVVDKTGSLIELQKPQIDYTTYGFFYTTEFDSRGIRLRYRSGKGIVTLPWGLIQSIKGLRVKKDKTVPVRIADVVLHDGACEAVNLVRDSKGGLKGKTALGAFSIRLDQVAAVFPITSNSPRSKQLPLAKEIAASATENGIVKQRTQPANRPARSHSDEQKQDLTYEKRALNKLRLAKLLLKNGKISGGKKWLNEVIREFPKSTSSHEAETILRSLGNGR